MTESRLQKRQAKRKDADPAAEAEVSAAITRDGEALAERVVQASESQLDAVEACCGVANDAFKMQRYDMAFAIVRAGLHQHGLVNDKLCKRYFFMLDTVVKNRISKKKPDAPPKMLYVRELLAALPRGLHKQLEIMGGPDGVKAGDRCVLFKDRGVMVVGLSATEWRLLLEKQAGPRTDIQMISGVEDAVIRGLTQCESMAEAQVELKMSWNHWAAKLCEAEDGVAALRAKCLLQRTVLLLGQSAFQRAIDCATDVLKIMPGNKHATALLATAMHKFGRKKDAAGTVTELCSSFGNMDDVLLMQDELGQPLDLVVSLLVEMHKTKEALKLLSSLLGHVTGPRHQPVFFSLARLYAKHGLNKDSLVLKLPSLCSRPPDRRTWDLLKSMAEFTPVAVEQQLQTYIDETGPGRFIHVPQITEVMCKLPFGAHGSAANKALQLLKHCASQVAPDRPEDLKIIVEDLRAFMSSNIPAQVSEQFPRTTASLLQSYIEALTEEHSIEAWEMPGEMMKRAFNNVPPPMLLELLQRSCLQLPPSAEQLLWPVFRNLPVDAGEALVRSWLLQHNDPNVDRMERCAKYFYQAKNQHAAALDLLRWAEAQQLAVCAGGPMWRQLYCKVLRATANERATMAKGAGWFNNSGLDMSTPALLEGGDGHPLETCTFPRYRPDTINFEITLHNITRSEEEVLAEFSESSPARTDAQDIEAGGHLVGGAAMSRGGRGGGRAGLSERTNRHLDLNGAQLLPGELLQQTGGGTDSEGFVDGEMTPLLEKEASTREEHQCSGGGVAAQSGSSSPTVLAPVVKEMFTQPQLEFAITTIDELGLREYVPRALNDPEAWSNFVFNLFTGFGWRLLGQEYAQPQRKILHQYVLADMQRLQYLLREDSLMREPKPPTVPTQEGEGVDEETRLLRLTAVVRDHRERCLKGKLQVEDMDTAEAVDSLVFEIGQRHIWQDRFGGVPEAGPHWLSFIHAPEELQARFKLAFLQAAEQLCPTSSPPAKDDDQICSTADWAETVLRLNKDADACLRMLADDPNGALTWASKLLQQAATGAAGPHTEALNLVCGDACFALKDLSRSISHFQQCSNYCGSAGEQGLPNDAVIELVCCMLQEEYPTSQVVRVAEDGALPGGPHTEGWVMLVRLLAELPDADSSSQAGEENQNVVNKLLMLLGSNATNKRERDARMQRCLQEGADGQAEAPAAASMRKTSRRQRCSADESSVQAEALQDYWQSLPLAERPWLCRVALNELNDGVLALSSSYLNAERHSNVRDGGAKSAADGDVGVLSPSDTLPMQLMGLLIDANTSTETASSKSHPGFSWSDALYDIQSLAESASATHTGVSEMLELSAHGLFSIHQGCVILGLPTDAAAPIGDVALGNEDHERSPNLVGNEDHERSQNVVLASDDDNRSSANGKTLERLLSVEASFDSEAAPKDQISLDLGPQVTLEQMMTMVRTVASLHKNVGTSLPHARDALCELCRRLLRKKAMRALLTAQRAVMAVLARMMLRAVRAAFEQEQQKLKKEEAARAERELLETLAEEEAEEQKRREMEEAEAAKRRAKKKEAEAAKKRKIRERKHVEIADDAGEPMDVGGPERQTRVPPPNQVIPADPSHAASTSRYAEVGEDGDTENAGSTASLQTEKDDPESSEDSAMREAREAAEALAVVEAEEAAQRAWEASLLSPSTGTWEVAKAGRRRGQRGATVDTDVMESMKEEQKGRRRGRNPQTTDNTGAAGGAPADEDTADVDAGRNPRKKHDRPRVPSHRSRVNDGDGSSDEAAVGSEMAGCSTGWSRGPATGLAGVEGQHSTARSTTGGAPRRLPRGLSTSDTDNAPDDAEVDSAASSGGGGPDVSAGRRGRRAGRSKERSPPQDGPEGSALAVPSSTLPSSGASAASTTSGSSGGRRKARNTPSTDAFEEDVVTIDAAAAPGLENKTGQHSCFVNVVVQTVWNVEAFREEFQRSRPRSGASEEDRSIFMAMAEVCSMMEDAASSDTSQSREAPKATASALKEALFRLDSNFELGEMHDATEAHEALLEALHRAVEEKEDLSTSGKVTSGSQEDMGIQGTVAGAPGSSSGNSMAQVSEPTRHEALHSGEAMSSSGDSFVKRIFAMRMRMEYTKPADPTEEQCKPVLFDQWTQYIVASELRDAVRQARIGALSASPLVTVLRKEAGLEKVADGQAVAPSRKLMLEPPRVFTLGLASDTAHATKSEISESLDGIQEGLNLAEVYEALGDQASCRLLALTAFYESHYVCFCYSQAVGQWIHYDDDTRRLVGRDFDAVREKCIAGRLHPQLLFYCMEK